jgi:hypothetical protein
MALVFADLVQENTSTTGTATLTLTGATSAQFQTFASIGDGNTTYYRIISGTDSEVGIGTYTLSGTTLSRDTVLSSIIGGVAGTTKITVASGATVICTYPAEKAVLQDATNNVNVPSATVGTTANYQSLVGAVTTKTPIHSVGGTDTNIALALQSKGTGGIDLAAGSSGVNISNGGTVTAITRISAGTGYTSFPSIAISAPTTAGGVQAILSLTTNGMFSSAATIQVGGTGYTLSDVVTLVGGTPTGGAATFTVTGVTAGVITAVTALNFGAYNVLPTAPVSVTGGTGTGATLNPSYGIQAPTITTSGSGYIEQPTVTFSGGGGSGASAYATVGGSTTIKNLGNITTFSTPNSNVLAIVDKNSAGNNPTNTTVAFSMIPQQSGFGASYLGFGSAAYLATAAVTSNAFIFATSVSVPVSNGGGGNTQLQIAHTASAVNYVQVTGAVTGTATIPKAPILSAQGSDTNISMALLPKGTGIVYTNQIAPVAYDATNTLLIADVLSQIITTTSTTAVSLTLPTGTLTDAGILGGIGAVNTAFEWSIINLGSAIGAITLVAGAAHTIVGSTAIAVGASARLKTRKTATNTFITYRIA